MRAFNKPEFGRQLNRSALLKFKNFRREASKSRVENFTKQVHEFCQLNNSCFMKYDEEANELIIRVDGF